MEAAHAENIVLNVTYWVKNNFFFSICVCVYMWERVYISDASQLNEAIDLALADTWPDKTIRNIRLLHRLKMHRIWLKMEFYYMKKKIICNKKKLNKNHNFNTKICTYLCLFRKLAATTLKPQQQCDKRVCIAAENFRSIYIANVLFCLNQNDELSIYQMHNPNQILRILFTCFQDFARRYFFNELNSRLKRNYFSHSHSILNEYFIAARVHFWIFGPK